MRLGIGKPLPSTSKQRRLSDVWFFRKDKRPRTSRIRMFGADLSGTAEEIHDVQTTTLLALLTRKKVLQGEIQFSVRDSIDRKLELEESAIMAAEGVGELATVAGKVVALGGQLEREKHKLNALQQQLWTETGLPFAAPQEEIKLIDTIVTKVFSDDKLTGTRTVMDGLASSGAQLRHLLGLAKGQRRRRP